MVRVDEHRRARQCGTKIRYRSAQRAWKARQQIASFHGEAPMDVYHCPHCGNFHLGHRRQAREPIG